MGSKRIGVALSDDAGVIAFPYGIVSVTDSTLDELRKIVAAEHVDIVVIGDSRDRENIHNAIHAAALQLGQELAGEKITVAYEWEGYSSAHARTLRSYTEGTPRGNIARKQSTKATKKHIDDSAAAVILQSYIDSHR